jgi:hypothetical protein
MVIETAPVIPRQEDDSAGPIGSLFHGIDQAGSPGLTITQESWWMFAIRLLGVIQLTAGSEPFLASL